MTEPHSERVEREEKGDAETSRRPRYRLIEVNPLFRRYSVTESDGSRTLVTRFLPRFGPRPEESLRQLLEAAEAHAAKREQVEHPAIPAIVRVRELPQGFIEVVEKMPRGTTLGQLVRRVGPLRADFVAALAQEVAGALEALHRVGSFHCALTPQRLVVAADGAVSLLEVGLMEIVFASQPDARFPDPRWEYVFPAPSLTPPELLGPDEPTARADVYVLAGLVYYALTGAYPFAGGSAMEVYAAKRRNKLRPLSNLRPDLPPSLRDAMADALRAWPDARPASPEALVASLFGPPEEVDSFAQAALHYRPYLPEVDYDTHRPTVRDAGPVAAGNANPLTAALHAAHTLDAMRTAHAQRRPTPRLQRKWLWAVLGAVLIAAALIAPLLMKKSASSPWPEPGVAPPHDSAERPVPEQAPRTR